MKSSDQLKFTGTPQDFIALVELFSNLRGLKKEDGLPATPQDIFEWLISDLAYDTGGVSDFNMFTRNNPGKSKIGRKIAYFTHLKRLQGSD